MRQAVADGTGRRADVYNRDPALELVVTCLVKEVAQRHDSRCFSDEVDSEPRSGASKHPDHGIQFLTSALQIGTRDGEVGSVQRASYDEEHLVLAIPELVFACSRLRQRDERRSVFDSWNRHGRIGQGTLGDGRGADADG